MLYTIQSYLLLIDVRQYKRIAFSSYLDHNVQNPGIDQAIIFNRIVINEGSENSEHSGW